MVSSLYFLCFAIIACACEDLSDRDAYVHVFGSAPPNVDEVKIPARNVSTV